MTQIARYLFSSAAGWLLFLCLAILLHSPSARAEPQGTQFTYQGSLHQAGQPFTGTAIVTFSLWDAPMDGNLVSFSISYNSLSIVDGLFNVELDFGPEPFNGEARWLQIIVNFEPLSPRQKLSAVPYALQTRGIRVDNDGRVGIGTSSPSTMLHVDAPAEMDALRVRVGTTTALRVGSNLNLAVRRGNLSANHPIQVGSNTGNGNGAHVTTGGVWTNASDRNTKQGFQPVDQREILTRLAEIPITRWRYRGESEQVSHIGPMAQDFHAAFGTGADDRFIGTIDASGVALAAIQGLFMALQQQEAEFLELQAESLEKLAQRDRRIDSLERDVRNLQRLFNSRFPGH
jgi:hypothetical protein